MNNALEVDGWLIGTGRRLMDLTVIECLNYVYAQLTANADADGRRKIDLALAGLIGEHGGEIVDDPDLPASMQGREAPSWWNGDHDPFAEQHELGGTDTKFHGVM